MHIDISRDTFDRTKHFARVLTLQGRVQLDADWNEQGAILWDYLRTLVADLVGPGWGPGDSLRIRYASRDNANPVRFHFEAAAGRYYVDGLPVRNLGKNLLTVQTPFAAHGMRLIWLRATERLVTAVEDQSLREVALGGADTAARTQIIQELSAASPPPKVNTDTAVYYRLDPEAAWRLFHEDPAPGGGLSARVHAPGDAAADPCVVPADAAYRGLENQLYRVQIYTDGLAGPEGATFLWSRDNGSVLARWVKTDGTTIHVEGAGREGLSGFAPGQWVQLLDDDKPGGDDKDLLLARIHSVAENRITLDVKPGAVGNPASGKHSRVRRWDSAGAQQVQVPKANDGYVPLEDGVEVRFEAGKKYTKGDYWLIPARTAVGQIEWPPPGEDDPAPARRTDWRRAVLAFVSFGAENADIPTVIDLRPAPRRPTAPETLVARAFSGAQAAVNIAPATTVPVLRLFASGVQVYAVKYDNQNRPTGWEAMGPQADLIDGHGRKVGALYMDDKSNLFWTAYDGSRAEVAPADVKPAPAPAADDLDWFVAKATPAGAGMLAGVKSVQQVFTVGGQAPAAGPTGDAPLEVPFLATYLFYTV